MAGLDLGVHADLSLYGADGHLAAIAEVKNRVGTSGQWAAKTRRNLLAHGLGHGPVFFLLVTRDRLYVWKDAGDEPIEVPPTYEEDITTTFAPYFSSAGLAAKQISGAAFELVVAAWLADLTNEQCPAQRAKQEWLDQSGFRTAVQDGRVELETDR